MPIPTDSHTSSGRLRVGSRSSGWHRTVLSETAAEIAAPVRDGHPHAPGFEKPIRVRMEAWLSGSIVDRGEALGPSLDSYRPSHGRANSSLAPRALISAATLDRATHAI